VRPRPYYAALFPGVPDDALEQMAYVFDYDHPTSSDGALREAHRALVARVQRWQQTYQPGQLVFTREDEATILVRDRRGGEERVEILHDPEDVALFEALDRPRRSARLARALGRDEGALRERLSAWREAGWVVHDPDAGRDLNVVVATT
jgi:hypothetical protein